MAAWNESMASVKARTRELVHTAVCTIDAESQDGFMNATAPPADLVWLVRFEKDEFHGK